MRRVQEEKTLKTTTHMMGRKNQDFSECPLYLLILRVHKKIPSKMPIAEFYADCRVLPIAGRTRIFPVALISRNFCELGNFTRKLAFLLGITRQSAFLLGMTRQLAFLLGNRRHEENRDQLLISHNLFIFYY